MKKIFLLILLLSTLYSVQSNAQRLYFPSGAFISDTNSTFYFSQGLRTGTTSYFGGSISFSSGFGILTNNGNVNVTNGGAFSIDGTNINTLFGSLGSRNTWTKWNKYDTLGVGSSAYFTFGSSTVTLNNADFYSGTIGTADLTVGHELNVTGATITGFNAVKISVDTITAPDEIVNIYGGLNILSGGYPIFGRTENQNVTFSRHNTSGDVIGLQLTSNGANITYYDSIPNTTTTFLLTKNIAKINSDTLATQSYVRSNGGTGSSIDTTSTISTKQNVLNQIWGYARDSSKIAFTDFNRTVTGRWTYSDFTQFNDSIGMPTGLFALKNTNGISYTKSFTVGDTLHASYIRASTRIISADDVIASSFTSNAGGGYKATAGGIFYFDTRTVIKSPFDGVLSFTNNAETSFDRINLGGNTSSFPSLKRFGTGLKLMLADTSGKTDLTLRNLFADTVKASVIKQNDTLVATENSVKNNFAFTSMTLTDADDTDTLFTLKPVIYLNNTGATITNYLPLAANYANTKIRIIKVDANHDYLIYPQGSETINGVNDRARLTSSNDYYTMELYSNGSQWFCYEIAPKTIP